MCALSSSFCLSTDTLRLNCSNDFLTVADSFAVVVSFTADSVTFVSLSSSLVPGEMEIIVNRESGQYTELKLYLYF